ncbi:hypothetical protein PtA15_9A563 [Puccinia triticina]|uniref:Uncharacterized protein n=1 Tax=Puccinia triticina TaxID=208348 RepID=A0ABY7CWE1_9BASI|nr:uncharacterized protein PtA15_9A563 [Puccinia triticina]WAQ88436.1 hypothetical protein PtA15_9A563 [Puccinia triticina]
MELLPLLHQLFTQISDLLNPITNLQNQPGVQLKLLLEAQSKLEHTFDQLQELLFRESCPRFEPRDPHLEEAQVV